MTKELWINLPVKNVQKTKEFFSNIGFVLNEKKSNETMACFTVGEKNTAVLFFAEPVFSEFTKSAIADARQSTEMVISFDAETREAVDEMARRVFEAGGTIYSEPSEIQGWLYNVGFTDPDGHCWNMLYMDHGNSPR
jgi:predicted lactoylglutathione lyase